MAGDREISNAGLYGLMVGMLLTGAANTLFMKYMDDEIVDRPKIGDNFNHPYMQSIIMFIGEFTVLGAYAIKVYCFRKVSDEDEEEIVTSPGTRQAEQAKLRTNINPLLLAIPAALDTCGSTIMFVGLTMCAASIYQMLRGFVVVITAALAWMFLGQK